MSMTKTMTPGDQLAYRGHVITKQFDGFGVSRNGFHIVTAPTLAGAKREIDALMP